MSLAVLLRVDNMGSSPQNAKSSRVDLTVSNRRVAVTCETSSLAVDDVFCLQALFARAGWLVHGSCDPDARNYVWKNMPAGKSNCFEQLLQSRPWSGSQVSLTKASAHCTSRPGCVRGHVSRRRAMLRRDLGGAVCSGGCCCLSCPRLGNRPVGPRVQ